MRAAIYYAPEPRDTLWTAASAWLGRDAETAAAVPQPAVPDIGEITREPRRYGFHATLKPPMRLATSYDQLLRDTESLAAGLTPFPLPDLVVGTVKGFVALREAEPSPELQALADRCVSTLDRHRAPPDEAELARRRRAPLSPEQDAMLVRWGYPYVFETWFFHMTLTRRLLPDEVGPVRQATARHFAPALAQRRMVDALCVFTQATEGAPFLVAERLRFGGR